MNYLERALVHLLNEETDKANELVHQFIVESARAIHESLREEDDASLDDESFFTEEDLTAGFEGEESEEGEVEGEVAADDFGGEVEEAGADLEDSLDADFGGDEVAVDGAEEGAADLETKIDDLEDELADLTAKFEEMMNELDAGDEDAGLEGEDFGGEADAEVAADDFGGEDFGGEVAADDAGDEVAEFDEDEFEDITESIIDELQKVTVPNTDGRHATGNGVNSANTKSMHGVKSSAHPAKPKSGGEHTGYARETAPSSETLKGGSTVASKARNVRADAVPTKEATPKPTAVKAKSPLPKQN